MLLNGSNVTTAIDIWAAGVVIASIYRGGYPIFHGNVSALVMSRIIKWMGPPTDEDMKAFNGTIMYDKEIKKKYSLKTHLSENEEKLDPKFIDLVSKMLIMNPYKRATARELLEHPYFDQKIKDDWKKKYPHYAK